MKLAGLLLLIALQAMTKNEDVQKEEKKEAKVEKVPSVAEDLDKLCNTLNTADARRVCKACAKNGDELMISCAKACPNNKACLGGCVDLMSNAFLSCISDNLKTEL